VALGIKIVAKKLNSDRYKSALALEKWSCSLINQKENTGQNYFVCFTEAPTRNSKKLKTAGHCNVYWCVIGVNTPCAQDIKYDLINKSTFV